MSRYVFSLGTQADDAQLRQRMAVDWIEGALAISLRREPSYAQACRLQGDPAQIIVGRDAESGRILATGNRSIAKSFLDGEVRRTAFLSDLRIDSEHRNGMLLSRVYRFLRSLHDADPLPCHTVVYDDNATALRSLVGGRAGLPHYFERGRLLTRALHLSRRKPLLHAAGAELRRARDGELPEIVEFLNRRNRQFRWAPVLDMADFAAGGRCDTLAAKDFFVGVRAGRICATMAAWDQSALRQVHIERYPRSLALLRHVHNLAAPLIKRPRLPAPGGALPYVYLAFVAAEQDETPLCAALLRHVYDALRQGPWLYAFAALHDDDPLLPLFMDYPAQASAARLFEVDFSRQPDAAAAPAQARIEFALT
ncbi:MAG TPA: hypothetical protein VF472_04410 [Burkholderiaceae bacterium]